MMKNILELIKKIINLIKNLKTNKPTEEVIIEEPIIKEPEIIQEPVIETPIVEQTPIVEEIKPLKLSVIEYQTYLNKIGFYTKEIDGINGNGSKKATKQFNIIFLNNNTEEYTSETDRLLKEIYASYCISPYMKDTDWKYFKNFKKTEYKCKCGGKYCNGYPSGISMHIVMADQYARNVYGKSVSISSGLRCSQWNKIQGGTANSVHPKGQASDSGIEGINASTLRATYKELPFVYYSYDITSKYVHKSVRL